MNSIMAFFTNNCTCTEKRACVRASTHLLQPSPDPSTRRQNNKLCVRARAGTHSDLRQGEEPDAIINTTGTHLKPAKCSTLVEQAPTG